MYTIYLHCSCTELIILTPNHCTELRIPPKEFSFADNKYLFEVMKKLSSRNFSPRRKYFIVIKNVHLGLIGFSSLWYVKCSYLKGVTFFSNEQRPIKVLMFSPTTRFLPNVGIFMRTFSPVCWTCNLLFMYLGSYVILSTVILPLEISRALLFWYIPCSGFYSNNIACKLVKLLYQEYYIKPPWSICT